MEQHRLLRDSLFNLSANVLSAALGLIAVPLFIARVPTGAYADWIVTLATAKSAVLVDFGVGWTIVRLVAADGHALGEDTKQHLRSAATFLFGLAVAAGTATFVAGWVQLGDLAGDRLVVLAAGGTMAAMSHFNNYSMGVLWGRRRFDLAGVIVAAEAAVQSSGVIVILVAGGGISGVALWEALAVSAAAAAKMVAASAVCRDAGFRPALRWPTAPRQIVRFSLASQISDGLSSLFWSLGILLVGQLASPSAVVAFNVAQKVPLALAGFVTRVAEVTMPAASGIVEGDSNSYATVAVSSARIAAALCVPAVVTIWLLAGPFLRLWVGSAAAVVPIMRIAGIAIAAHSLGESARYFLWGSGRVWTIVLIQAAGAAILIAGTAALFAHGDVDVVSFAALQALAVGAMAVALSLATAGRAGLSGGAYAIRVARGMPLAGVAAVAAGVGLTTLWPAISWAALVTTAAAVTGTFVALMVGFGLDPQESIALRRLVRQA